MEAHQPAGLGPSTRARHLPAGRVLRGMKRDLTGRDLYARVERLQHLVQHRLEWRGYTERQRTTRTIIRRAGTLRMQITQPCGTDPLPRARRRLFLRARGGGPRQQASLSSARAEERSCARAGALLARAFKCTRR